MKKSKPTKKPRQGKNDKQGKTQKRLQKEKKKYKVRNWSEYNKSLVERGSLELWIEEGIAKLWIEKDGISIKKTNKRGRKKKYTDKAIETCRLIGKVFHQGLRQTQGFVGYIFKQAGIHVEVPDYSTLSRRGGRLKVQIPKKKKEAVVAILDSTGLKIYGEGEWKVRKHGWGKHRTWMKLHISMDTDGEIRGVILTDNSVDDATAGVEMLKEQFNEADKIEEIKGDGGYDKRKIYDTCEELKVKKVVIPPQKNAKIWKHGNKKGEKHVRDENLRKIRKTTRKRWKEESEYHKRSNIETCMFRGKMIFGDRLSSRSKQNQETEVRLMCKALNIMMYNGMPDSYPDG